MSGLKVTSPCGCAVSPAQFVKQIVFRLFFHVRFDSFVKNLASGAVWVYFWVLDPIGQCVSVCCHHTGLLLTPEYNLKLRVAVAQLFCSLRIALAS